MKRILTVGGAVILLSALQLGTVLAQYPPTATATISLSDKTVAPGEGITVSGSGWQARSRVTITFRSRPQLLGTASVDGAGRFSTGVSIPANATPGRHAVIASGTDADGDPAAVTATLQVVGAAGAGGAGGLARTGGIPAGLVVVAMVMIVVGAAALVIGRRRMASR